MNPTDTETAGGTGMATGLGSHMGLRYGFMGALLGLSLMQVDLKAHHREEPVIKKPVIKQKATPKVAAAAGPSILQRILSFAKGDGDPDETPAQSVRQRWTGPDLAPSFDRPAAGAPKLEEPKWMAEVEQTNPRLKKEEPVSQRMDQMLQKAHEIKERQRERSQPEPKKKAAVVKSRKAKNQPMEPVAAAKPAPAPAPVVAMPVTAKAFVAEPIPAAAPAPEKGQKSRKAGRDARWAGKRARRNAGKQVEKKIEPVAAAPAPAPATAPAPVATDATDAIQWESGDPSAVPGPVTAPPPAVIEEPKPVKISKVKSSRKKSAKKEEVPVIAVEPISVEAVTVEPVVVKELSVIAVEPAKQEPVTESPAAVEPVTALDVDASDKIKELQARKRKMLMDGGSTYQIRKVDAVIAEIRRTGTVPAGI